MPAPVVIQESFAPISTAQTLSEIVETWNITAGSTLVAAIQHRASSGDMLYVEDSVAGAWTLLVHEEQDGRRSAIYYFENHPGGSNVNITFRSDLATTKWGWVWELTPCSMDVSGSHIEPLNTNTFPHAAAPGLDTLPDVFGVAVLTHNASAQAHVLESGWSDVYEEDGNRLLVQERFSDSALSAQRAIATNTGTSRRGAMVLGFFAESGAPPVNLVVQDARHAHTSEVVTLEPTVPLFVADVRHGHASDEIALDQANTLAVDASRHAHVSDEPVLGAETILAVLDSTHPHVSDDLALLQASELVVDDGVHAHRSPELVLGTGVQLVVADCGHAHASDEVALEISAVVAVDDVRHLHASDTVDLAVFALLGVDDSRHAHRSTNVIVLDDSVGVAEREGTLVYVQPEPLVMVEAEPLVIVQ